MVAAAHRIAEIGIGRPSERRTFPNLRCSTTSGSAPIPQQSDIISDSLKLAWSPREAALTSGR